MNKLFKNKKFKYGSLSIVFTAAFIALIIFINVILTSVAAKTNLVIDITKQEFYSVSEGSKQVLSTLDDFDITIYFLADRDLYERDKYALMVRQLGEEYAKLYPDNIKVEYKDVKKDPAFANKYRDEAQSSLSSNNIIIQGTHHFRVLGLDYFFERSSETGDYFSFVGETRFTAAMLQCSIEEPQVVTFTTGHGETSSPKLLDILVSAGFEIQVKDLSKEDIDERTEILIISNPTADFLGIESGDVNDLNEIDKISNYMKGYKDLIVFVNASTRPLPNLQDYLYEYWGINYKPYHKIQDLNHSVATGGNDGYSIVGQYANNQDNTAGYNITKVAAETGSGFRTVFRNAVELKADTGGDYMIETVMQTTNQAVSISKNEDNEEATTDGEFPLMLLSTAYNYGENNVKMFKYVLLVSSTDFASDTFLTESFGNGKLVLGAARVMSTEMVIPDIDAKLFAKEAMNIEAGTANALTWLVSAVFPLIIILIGLFVFIKRRHL